MLRQKSILIKSYIPYNRKSDVLANSFSHPSILRIESLERNRHALRHNSCINCTINYNINAKRRYNIFRLRSWKQNKHSRAPYSVPYALLTFVFVFTFGAEKL